MQGPQSSQPQFLHLENEEFPNLKEIQQSVDAARKEKMGVGHLGPLNDFLGNMQCILRSFGRQARQVQSWKAPVGIQTEDGSPQQRHA